MLKPVYLPFVVLLFPGLEQTVPAASTETESVSPPNIVLIYADDLGYADLACYGNDFFETPHIDALITSGMQSSR